MNDLITRTHTAESTHSVAIYSACEKYRYSLTRVWNPKGPRVMFVMLNPSTASEVQNDPTVERCERRARHLGYGAFRVTNIFAWRATDPRKMRAASEPIGPQNKETLTEGGAWADHIIAAWGVHGSHLDQGPRVAKDLAQMSVPLFHLGLTKAGHPRHPLYLSYAQQPEIWTL